MGIAVAIKAKVAADVASKAFLDPFEAEESALSEDKDLMNINSLRNNQIDQFCDIKDRSETWQLIQAILYKIDRFSRAHSFEADQLS
jgi:hypothetical protein